MLKLDSEVRLKVTHRYSGTETVTGEVAELPCLATGWRYVVIYTDKRGHWYMSEFDRTDLTPVGLPAPARVTYI